MLQIYLQHLARSAYNNINNENTTRGSTLHSIVSEILRLWFIFFALTCDFRVFFSFHYFFRNKSEDRRHKKSVWALLGVAHTIATKTITNCTLWHREQFSLFIFLPFLGFCFFFFQCLAEHAFFDNKKICTYGV